MIIINENIGLKFNESLRQQILKISCVDPHEPIPQDESSECLDIPPRDFTSMQGSRHVTNLTPFMFQNTQLKLLFDFNY